MRILIASVGGWVGHYYFICCDCDWEEEHGERPQPAKRLEVRLPKRVDPRVIRMLITHQHTKRQVFVRRLLQLSQHVPEIAGVNILSFTLGQLRLPGTAFLAGAENRPFCDPGARRPVLCAGACG